MEQYINFNLSLEPTDYIFPPHLVPEYRDWICRYLGVMGEIIKIYKETDLSEKSKKRLQQSFYGKEMHVYEDEELYGFGREYEYELYHYSSDCWTPGCSGNYFIFRTSDTQYMVVFNIGDRRPIKMVKLSERQENAFRDFLKHIHDIILLGAEEIVLCGHSNGMSSAIFTTFLLTFISRFATNEDTINDYFIQQGLIDDSIFNVMPEFKDLGWIFGLEQKLVVCGTAGFPILFQNREQFNIFCQSIGNRYLHIGLGYHYGKNDIQMDPFMRDQDELDIYNFDYHIYVYSEFPEKGTSPSYSYYAELGNPERMELSFEHRYGFLHEFELYRKTLALYFCR